MNVERHRSVSTVFARHKLVRGMRSRLSMCREMQDLVRNVTNSSILHGLLNCQRNSISKYLESGSLVPQIIFHLAPLDDTCLMFAWVPAFLLRGLEIPTGSAAGEISPAWSSSSVLRTCSNGVPADASCAVLGAYGWRILNVSSLDLTISIMWSHTIPSSLALRTAGS